MAQEDSIQIGIALAEIGQGAPELDASVVTHLTFKISPTPPASPPLKAYLVCHFCGSLYSQKRGTCGSSETLAHKRLELWHTLRMVLWRKLLEKRLTLIHTS